ncbi:Heterocyst differentiation ATP-binding protein HepA [compost metagenome]
MEFEDDYSTMVVDGGRNLSGGQKQRIALARALVRDSKLLVLDEATSALDATSEKLVHQAIIKAAETRKVIMITHHLNRIMDVDQVLVMDCGRIVEAGNVGECCIAAE